MSDCRTRWSAPCRLLAFVVVLALVVTVATPARADADALTALAIASAVVAGVILIAYLVVASVHDSRTGGEGRVIWLACAGEGCAEIAVRAAQAPAPFESQAP